MNRSLHPLAIAQRTTWGSTTRFARFVRPGVQEVGESKAGWRYMLNAFTFLRPLPENSRDKQGKKTITRKQISPI